MAKELYKDEAWLRKKYWQEQKCIREIAIECVKADPTREVWILETTIRNWMIKYGIPRRTKSESHILAHRRDGHKSSAIRKKEKIIAKLRKTSQQLWDLAEEIRELEIK